MYSNSLDTTHINPTFSAYSLCMLDPSLSLSIYLCTIRLSLTYFIHIPLSLTYFNRVNPTLCLTFYTWCTPSISRPLTYVIRALYSVYLYTADLRYTRVVLHIYRRLT